MRKVALAAFVAYSALLVFSSPAQSLPDCKDGRSVTKCNPATNQLAPMLKLLELVR